MKKFKCSLAISGTESELKSLIPELEKLGYRFVTEVCLNASYLNTNYANINNEFGYNSVPNLMDYGKRTLVHASNPQLVLALAAMVDSDETYKGEWSICVFSYRDKTYGYVNKGDFKMAEKDDHNSSENWRKATKDELMQHFTSNSSYSGTISYSNTASTFNTVSASPKKPIGSELIKDLPFAKAGKVFTPENDRKDYFNYNGGSFHSAVFIDSIKNIDFFKPIYKAKSIKVSLRHLLGEFEVEVSQDGIFFDRAWIDVSSLRDVVKERVLSYKPEKHKSAMPTEWMTRIERIDLGCKKSVPLDDIKKVLNTYDSYLPF